MGSAVSGQRVAGGRRPDTGLMAGRRNLAAVPLLAVACALAVTAPAVGAPESAASRDLLPVVSQVDVERPIVFLTIDDGIVQTPQALALLRDSRIPVAIFPIGAVVRDSAAYWQATDALPGVSLHSHTLTHPSLAGMDYASQRAEICGGIDAVAAVSRTWPRLLRPPYGAYDETTLRAARACGATHVVMWSASVENGNVTTVHGGPLRAGDIILMHYQDAFPVDLAAVIAAAREQGLRFGNLTQNLPGSPTRTTAGADPRTADTTAS